MWYIAGQAIYNINRGCILSRIGKGGEKANSLNHV